MTIPTLSPNLVGTYLPIIVRLIEKVENVHAFCIIMTKTIKKQPRDVMIINK